MQEEKTRTRSCNDRFSYVSRYKGGRGEARVGVPRLRDRAATRTASQGPDGDRLLTFSLAAENPPTRRQPIRGAGGGGEPDSADASALQPECRGPPPAAGGAGRPGAREPGPRAAEPQAMEDEQPDSLEGWVPVREDLFAEPERHRLRFLVAWNDAEGKFAVTCHDRTAQRRRREGSRPEPEPAASPPSWAGLLSAAGLRGAHRQLAALWPPLESCFPPLPPELEARAGGAWGLGLGLWALVWPARAGLGDAALQELCGRLERYLGDAASGCGGAAVRDALFPADGGAPDCESLRDFRERTLRARWTAAGARLRQVRAGPLPLARPGPPQGCGRRGGACAGVQCSREPGCRRAGGRWARTGRGARRGTGACHPWGSWGRSGGRACSGWSLPPDPFSEDAGRGGCPNGICRRRAKAEPETAVVHVGNNTTD